MYCSSREGSSGFLLLLLLASGMAPASMQLAHQQSHSCDNNQGSSHKPVPVPITITARGPSSFGAEKVFSAGRIPQVHHFTTAVAHPFRAMALISRRASSAEHLQPARSRRGEISGRPSISTESGIGNAGPSTPALECVPPTSSKRVATSCASVRARLRFSLDPEGNRPESAYSLTKLPLSATYRTRSAFGTPTDAWPQTSCFSGWCIADNKTPARSCRPGLSR